MNAVAGRPLHKRTVLTFSRDMAQLKRLYHAILLDPSLDRELAERACEDLVRTFESIKCLRNFLRDST